MPILKTDGAQRLCGDYKVTINKINLPKIKSYLLPRIEELFSSLAGGESFFKLYLSHAYLQIELDGTTKEYVTLFVKTRHSSSIQNPKYKAFIKLRRLKKDFIKKLTVSV